MKKIISVLLVLVCICAMLPAAVNAATDPMAVKFENALGLLDHFYDFDYHYMIRIATDPFVSWDEEGPFTATAAEFEGELRKHFSITDKQIQELRELGNRDYNTEIFNEETWEVIEVIPFYNEETKIYTFQFYGGFGGNLAPRQYLGYVKNGTTYDVYYQNITYAYLENYLPDGVDEWEYAESLGYPEFIELEGLRFQDGPNGFYCVLSYDDFGRKYTVELNGDTIRILSCTEYNKSQLPGAFDDKEVEEEVIYDIPAGGSVTIPENDCFDGNTVVKVEEIQSGNVKQTIDKAMKEIAANYVAFDFTATKNNVSVQPNGKLTVTFAIPNGFSNNVAVFYMAASGTLEELNATVSTADKTVTVRLEHFSVYILADKDSKTHQHDYEAVVTEPTCTNEGYTTYTCACGDTYIDDKVDASEHAFGEWTETEDGKEKRECTSCGYEQTRDIGASASDNDGASAPDNDGTSEDASQPDTDSSESVSSDASDKVSDKENGGNNTVVIVLVIAAVVIAAGVVAFVIIRKKQAKQ